MRLPIVPAWFPLRALALQGVMALCVLLFCFAPLWYVTWKLEADIKGLETRIQVQETLQERYGKFPRREAAFQQYIKGAFGSYG